MNLNIYPFQYDIQWLNPQANISLVKQEVESIQGDFDLMILPEMFLSGFCMDPEKSAVSENGAEIQALIALSKQKSIAFIGSLSIEADGEYFNRVLLITENGISGRYDKQYLYSPSGENKAFSIKYDTNLMTFKHWKILPQVCYDLRFPENVRQLPPPDLLIYMANWPLPRIHHWDALLKARAIENQCFTVGCNRLGKDGNDWEYPGHSTLLRYDGEILNQETGTASRIFELTKEDMAAYRSKYRFLEDKKV